MVLAYCRGGDLHRVVRRLGGRLAERQAAELVVAPLVAALAHLHGRGVIHRDVKAANVLYTEGWELKLCDLGVAVDLCRERAVTRAGRQVTRTGTGTGERGCLRLAGALAAAELLLLQERHACGVRLGARAGASWHPLGGCGQAAGPGSVCVCACVCICACVGWGLAEQSRGNREGDSGLRGAGKGVEAEWVGGSLRCSAGWVGGVMWCGRNPIELTQLH